MELTRAALLVFFLPTIQAITDAATSSYIHVPGKTLPGPFPTHSFKVKMNLTLNQCAAQCSLEYHLKRFPCYAFEYAAASKTCVLTNITTLMINGGYLGLRDSPVMDFYERSKGPYLNLFQPVHGKVLQDQKSYFAIFYNMTREKCALFCLLETRDTCMSFSYSSARQVCGLSKLFYTKTNGQALIPSSLYDHYQYSTTWPCNATIPWSYSPTAIASPYFPYASLKDVNCHVIIEAPIGKQIDLQFSTFFTQRNICDGGKNGLTIIDGSTPSSQNVLKTLCNSDNFVNRRFMSTSGYLYIQFATGSVPMAFKAVYNFVTPDPCANSPCQNAGNCSAVSAGFVCTCAPGYTGSLCETDVDECASAPCLFGGQCIDKVDSFECVCPNMLGGHRCDLFVGLCSEQPCQNGAKCSPRGQNNYVCDCPEGFIGKNCSETAPHDPCDPVPCQNNGTCHSSTRYFTCACAEGFTGVHCETNIDDCKNNPCYFNVPCVDLVNDYRCECPPILSGKRCETFIGKCSENPCVNGHCSPLQRDNYTCSCFAGFTGRNCTEKTFNFCSPSPCIHGTCTSYENGPSCFCDFDYEGLLCDRRINHCSHVNCNMGECKNLEGDFRCDCIEGYTGRFCNETIDHCRHNTCGTGKCINTMTNHFCLCEHGQTGINCQSSIINQNCSVDTCVHGICTLENGTSKCICVGGYLGDNCNQIDHCISNSCIHGACANQPNGYTCSCDPGYTGANCTEEIDHCKEAGCMYGLCQNTASGFSCICAVGYHGDLCQYREGETGPPAPTTSKMPTYSEILSTKATTGKTIYCGANTCINGVCSDVLKDSCSCHDGFIGQRCEIFVGCGIYNPCYHGGVCSETNKGFSCSCGSNYTGLQCETPLTDPEYSSCDGSPCLNNGTCSTDGNHCICTEEFTGDRCQFFNKCRNSPCITGKCVQTGNRIRCEIKPLVGHSNTSLGLPFMPGNSYTMVCPPVRGDNPRALASGLSPRTGGQTMQLEFYFR